MLYSGQNAVAAYVSSDDREASVLFVIGGSCHGATQHATSLAYDVVVFIDAANEIETTRCENGVIRMALAPGETLGTLIESECCNRYPDVVAAARKLIEKRPGVSLYDGMGQTPAVGFLAAQKLIDEPRFEELMEEILNRLLEIHNTLPPTAITLAGGSGGGTAPGAAEVIERAATAYLLENGVPESSSEILRVGPLSHLRLGRRIRPNAAATFVRDLALHFSEDRDPRHSRSMLLTELPIVGKHQDLRDQFSLQLLQALRARGVQRELRTFKPNDSTGSSLGSIVVVRPHYWFAIPDRLVAANVASVYLAKLGALKATPPNREAIEELKPVTTPRPADAASPEELVEYVEENDVRPANLLDLCTRPRFDYAADIEVYLRDGSVAAALNPAASFPPCYTVKAFHRKLGICRAIVRKLKAKRREILADRETRIRRMDRLRVERERAVKRIASAIARVYPQTPWHWLIALLLSPQAKLDGLQNAITAFQEVDNELRKLGSEDRAMANGIKRLTEEDDQEVARLERVVRHLQQHASHRPIRRSELLVEPHEEMDGLLKALLAISLGPLGSKSDKESQASLTNLLTRCTRRVTLKGLARITGSPHATPEDIAWALATKKAPTVAPIWGATDPTSPGTTMVVLPPVDSDLEACLRDNLAVLAPDKILISSDTAQGGVNTVCLQVWRPERVKDICNRYLSSQVDAAANRLCMPEGTAPIDRFQQLSQANGQT